MRRLNPRPRFYLMMLAILLVVMSISFGVIESGMRRGRAVLAEKKAERDALVGEIGNLQKEIDFAQTDAYIERVARDELGLIMPNEVRYVTN